MRSCGVRNTSLGQICVTSDHHVCGMPQQMLWGRCRGLKCSPTNQNANLPRPYVFYSTTQYASMPQRMFQPYRQNVLRQRQQHIRQGTHNSCRLASNHRTTMDNVISIAQPYNAQVVLQESQQATCH